ncbi:prenyltransferase [Salinicoccus carnicancri]|uniref:prenyltransferase n=1 Tax=Salinicoccus carnicancri TaxID=558170 RepID=UPI00030D175C|nr:prenyltransferase [Salinicoccus carnicancri]
MTGENASGFKGVGMLLRVVAVAASSVVTVISTWLPLLIHYEFSMWRLLFLLALLMLGAFLIHGALTHVFNDITDFESGTDQHSPALLSGGSRVIQSGVMSVGQLRKIALTLTVSLAGLALLLAILGQAELAILITVGIWGAASYSLRPFRFAYIPLAGEWLSLFPSMLLLGVAAPWLMLEAIPAWGWQNAFINALWCLSWVMVHHIPDMEADQKATPVKRTSVVWSSDMFGLRGARYPAILYLAFIGLFALPMMLTRPVAGIMVIVLAASGIYMIVKMDLSDPEAVTAVEKKLLLLAMTTAVGLGIFI